MVEYGQWWSMGVVEGGGGQPNGIHWCQFHLHILYHTKQVNPWPNPSASHVVNCSWLSACQRRLNHLKTTRALVDVCQASETNNSKSSLDNFQHQQLPTLLVNVYSYSYMVYHLMVKSLSSCCVHAWKLAFLRSLHVCMCVCTCVCILIMQLKSEHITFKMLYPTYIHSYTHDSVS